MAQIGAEIGQMQSLQSTFTRESANVAELTSTLTAQVGQTWWVGPAAERFKGQWESEFRPMLQRLQESLDACSQEVQQRSHAIEAAGS
jgi:uncharacterized protein YukE